MNKVVIGYSSGQFHAVVRGRVYSCMTYVALRRWVTRELYGW